LTIVAAFDPPALISGFDDLAVMGQAVERRGGHFGVAEDAGPLAEGEVCGDDDTLGLTLKRTLFIYRKHSSILPSGQKSILMIWLLLRLLILHH
jgi:hypothetical protein